MVLSDVIIHWLHHLTRNSKVHSRDRALASETGFQAHSQFQCSKVRPKSGFLLTMSLSFIWKWIRSCEQNSAPESRHASLHSVKVIKMVRLAIDRFLILWSLHRSLCCCETNRETDHRTFLSLDTKDDERKQLWCARNCTRNHCLFNCSYLFAWSRLTEITPIDLILCLAGQSCSKPGHGPGPYHRHIWR